MHVVLARYCHRSAHEGVNSGMGSVAMSAEACDQEKNGYEMQFRRRRQATRR